MTGGGGCLVIPCETKDRSVLALYEQNPTFITRKALNYSVAVLCKHLHMSRVCWSNPLFAFVFRCSRKEACQKWELPQHFSTELKQCVDITVSPANMSVTSPSTQVTTRPLLSVSSRDSDHTAPFLVERILLLLKNGTKHDRASWYAHRVSIKNPNRKRNLLKEFIAVWFTAAACHGTRAISKSGPKNISASLMKHQNKYNYSKVNGVPCFLFPTVHTGTKEESSRL